MTSNHIAIRVVKLEELLQHRALADTAQGELICEAVLLMFLSKVVSGSGVCTPCALEIAEVRLRDIL
jgi:hypothetical protein